MLDQTLKVKRLVTNEIKSLKMFVMQISSSPEPTHPHNHPTPGKLKYPSDILLPGKTVGIAQENVPYKSRVRFLQGTISTDTYMHTIQSQFSKRLGFALVIVCFKSVSVDFANESVDFVLS